MLLSFAPRFGAFSLTCAEEDLRMSPRLARSMRLTKVVLEVRGGGRRPVKSSTIFPNSALVLGTTADVTPDHRDCCKTQIPCRDNTPTYLLRCACPPLENSLHSRV